MIQPSQSTPPFSPILLAGMLARPLPPALLQPALGIALAAIRRNHPEVFERLSGLGSPVFLIDPVDLPFVFVLNTDAQAPELRCRTSGDGMAATATIRGPLLTLIDLLEGRLDGDALFFSRELAIEGDTEAVVALSNAVDGAEIEIGAAIASLLGPLAGPARFLAGAAGTVFSRISEDLETLRGAAIGPVLRHAAAQTARLDGLDEAVGELKRTTAKSRGRKR
jgi:O2-independent ubiquinone biosynthesis accessory factor UbiT